MSNLVGPRRTNPTKLGAYESGKEPLANLPGTRFSVKFYVVDMMIPIFELESSTRRGQGRRQRDKPPDRIKILVR